MENLDIIDFYKEILNTGTFLRIPTKGHSMKPLIKNGSNIIIKKANLTKITKGDIILFFDGQRLIAHRVIRKSKHDGNTKFIVKGDSTLHFDKPVYSKDILGKVVKIENGSKIINLDNTSGKTINIIFTNISLVITIIYFVIKFLKQKAYKIFRHC
ncbi:signal peptidase I [Methanosarcina sp. Z-7115]|uniref:Signal peptidase I n=1 Tax=Methanosarcina baikalica TaxID=3073890 RepID=A0ABU2D4G9_9EURY|nr:signal peptidase I [Methanosarcina sp. Z-7115]MDR7666851.1 signal peptidase I [Methanosarcina sp. Z-7115]